ncbi:uncharacterized protein EI97DRAFT_393194 [Westerdykella ornata]|uniref:HAUS augmin-like complex subunit 6 N-terminal domain-containing protein n=1 Tax=Westerdykella ornata TaxID=318751 RepID=A0A6A6JQ22_WESOR|nr:uncharacterized protein EI97DRAFT_393194 [Westerdykella ornata]KAF2278632.1 hypothetical protein EI97DRAFT_393194 [Westerdykella ornata]
MSRPLSQTTASANNAAGGLTRSLSTKTNTSTRTSDIRLYVTNLRLLDLDLRPDWPGITVQTFSSKNADQKQRIGGVEWSLFRLFEIWDPHETSQKLQPFFPPLEPLQSLNLRAALYRCLNDLKKNGVLGRETVLRKTMLDECKGEKFFELLAVFSNVVLKKVISERDVGRRTVPISRDLAMASTLPARDQASFIPLAIAHKAALMQVLNRKEEKRRRFKDFENLLDKNAAAIEKRVAERKTTAVCAGREISEKDFRTMKKQLKDNWVGDQKWIDAMLHGDSSAAEDVFLGMHFNDVWPMVEQGCKLEETAPAIGLLESLQSMVQEQQARLKKWKDFHQNMRRRVDVKAQKKTPNQGVTSGIKLDSHLGLQLQSAEPREKNESKGERLQSQYQEIITAMDSGLSHISKARYNRPFLPMLSRRRPSTEDTRTDVPQRKLKPPLVPNDSHVEPLKQNRAYPPPLLQPKARQKMHAPCDNSHSYPPGSDTTLVGHPSTNLSNDSDGPKPVEESLPGSPHSTPSASPAHFPTSSQPADEWPSEPPRIEEPPINDEDDLAERIISSIGDATPSPVKRQPRPSLLERTQMSMARNAGLPSIADTPSSELPKLPELSAQLTAPTHSESSLLERTRHSMAAMSQAQRTTQSTKENRKSRSRQSLYPVNQFDTPRSRKSFQAIEEAKSGDTTPKEVLFSDDVDYEHVFKSRPRVAQSPIFTPLQTADDQTKSDSGENYVLSLDEDDGYDEGVTGVDLADVDAEGERGYHHAWDNSPLRHAGGGAKARELLFR